MSYDGSSRYIRRRGLGRKLTAKQLRYLHARSQQRKVVVVVRREKTSKIGIEKGMPVATHERKTTEEKTRPEETTTKETAAKIGIEQGLPTAVLEHKTVEEKTKKKGQ